MTADERIVCWLREAPGAVSGEELARRLGCTRAAVWKRIAALRRQGYRIDGRRAGGYALAAHLGGRWRDVRWFAECDSTQRVARDLARAGAAEGTTVIAERQTAGRGRLGRAWHSPPGLNLYCSVLLRPPLAADAVPQIGLVAGAAVAAAVAEETGRRPAIKWPNDVLVDGRKVCGILTEMESEVERVRHVIVGIGVNLNAPLASFPRELRPRVTSLRVVTGVRIDRARFTGRLLAALEARYGRYLSAGFSSVRAEWESYSCLTGTEVRVASSDGDVAGRVLGLDDDGALRVARVGGDVVRVVAGEVTLRARSGSPG